ncbi:MAG: hypothetical protein P8179_19605 [Candidatus Thiodiazotropha sp.]|jgi:hypothetical protein
MIDHYDEFNLKITKLGLYSKLSENQVRGGSGIDDIDGILVYKNSFVVKKNENGCLVLTLPKGNTRKEYLVNNLLECIPFIHDHYIDK